MATVRAVKNPENDPKEGRPRAKSGVRFPYNDLDESIEVAKIVHEKAGGVCDLAQLAILLNYSGVSNGTFRMRVSAAKMFGLIEEADELKIRVSSRGKAIVAPIASDSAARAKVEAFMTVDLFKKVYERFNGTALPEQVGLRNLLATEYGVVPDRIPPTVRIMLDSAEQAGLFKTAGNRTRMVLPLTLPVMGAQNPPPDKRQTPAQDDGNAGVYRVGGSGGGGGGNGGGDVGEGIDPAFLGMLRRLPATGERLNRKRREAAINAFTAILDLVYPEVDEE